MIAPAKEPESRVNGTDMRDLQRAILKKKLSRRKCTFSYLQLPNTMLSLEVLFKVLPDTRYGVRSAC